MIVLGEAPLLRNPTWHRVRQEPDDDTPPLSSAMAQSTLSNQSLVSFARVSHSANGVCGSQSSGGLSPRVAHRRSVKREKDGKPNEGRLNKTSLSCHAEQEMAIPGGLLLEAPFTMHACERPTWGLSVEVPSRW